MSSDTATRAAEKDEQLWLLPASPVVWAAHFLLSYITAAVWCAKVAEVSAPLSTVRTAILVYSVVALAIIAVIGVRGFQAHGLGSETLPHDSDSPEDRHRFLGFATLLLSGISAVAVIYASLVIVFIETCQ